MRDLFRGPLSLTYRGERLAFYLTLLFAFPAAGAIGFFIHEEIGISQVALFLVIAMIYVTLARGRLVGSSVRIHEAQYPHLFAIVERCVSALGLPMPLVFVREDYTTAILTVGFGEPYSLVLSSSYLEHFKDDELAFIIGRELGHIASGHTRLTSLLSVNGNENVIVSLVFGAWLRKTELTCDRVGLLCCGSLDAAMRGIAIASFSHFGRKIDHRVFAEQAREMGTDSVYRIGEWLGSVPYATTRIDAMREFMQSNLYQLHEERFVQHAAAHPATLPQAAGVLVEKRDCAGWWRRFSAALLDVIIISAILQLIFFGHPKETQLQAPVASAAASAGQERIKERSMDLKEAMSMDEIVAIGPIDIRAGAIVIGKHVVMSITDLRETATSWWIMPFWLGLYSAVLVALVGQTPGMLILSLRVVRTDFGRVTAGQSVWRYAVATFLWWLVLMLSPFSRVYLQDTLSGTRLVKTERVLARASAA